MMIDEFQRGSLTRASIPPCTQDNKFTWMRPSRDRTGVRTRYMHRSLQTTASCARGGRRGHSPGTRRTNREQDDDRASTNQQLFCSVRMPSRAQTGACGSWGKRCAEQEQTRKKIRARNHERRTRSDRQHEKANRTMIERARADNSFAVFA